MDTSIVGASPKQPECDGIEYREIREFPGYRVGSDGSIWSCMKVEKLFGKYGTKSAMSDKWHRLDTYANPTGHVRVTLSTCWKTGKRGSKSRFVHRLVLESFVGPCPPGMQCRHFPDRNPGNNSIGNLQWGTCKENAGDRVFHGTQFRGESHPRRKLNDQIVRRIKDNMASNAVSQRVLAKELGITESAVSKVVTGKAWAHV